MNINLIPIRKLNRIQMLRNKFIWGNKKARVKQTILEKDIRTGGLVVPNVKRYCYAAILSAYLYLWNGSPESY